MQPEAVKVGLCSSRTRERSQLIEPTGIVRGFDRGITDERPKNAHWFEAFSPKLERRLRLFSRAQVYAWLWLESDPHVRRFCERPVYVDRGQGAELIHFWIRRDDGDELWFVDEALRVDDRQPQTQLQVEIGAGRTLPVRTITARDLQEQSVWLTNWERIIPYLAANRLLMTPALLSSAGRLLTQPKALTVLARELAPIEGVLVWAAAFTLLHRGRLAAPGLRTEALSSQTIFEPVQAG